MRMPLNSIGPQLAYNDFSAQALVFNCHQLLYKPRMSLENALDSWSLPHPKQISQLIHFLA
jgi:hypothetical protein